MFGLAKREKIHSFLTDKGADAISHIKRKTFHEHLTRVGELLAAWGGNEDLVHAGLCHSLYSSEAFEEALLTLDQREDLKALIGEESEKLVFHFCSMRRESFQRNDEGFAYIDRINGLEIHLSHTDGVQLLHLLFANDIDHIHHFNVGGMSSFITRRYARFAEYLSSPACIFFEQFKTAPALIPNGEEYVRFIGHAGVHLKTKEFSVAIDPWLYSSVREKGRLQGFEPQNYTIDFMIPEPRNTIADLDPDIVLLSHFHTHHAPFQEIKEFAARKPITIVCPPIQPDRLEAIKKLMGSSIYESITFNFVADDTTLVFGGITIRAIHHTQQRHIGFFVSTPSGSVLHLADPRANNHESLLFDPIWDKFNDLRPDFAFISCAGHAGREVLGNGERIIKENETFTPTQAAKFAVKIGAKAAGACGIFNHSVWTDRVEMSRTSAEAEKEFHWALSFLSPATRVLTLRPGDIYYFDT
jgi:L-ascorbate metabolism protein UlaG (beta-lactamase superfamily)